MKPTSYAARRGAMEMIECCQQARGQRCIQEVVAWCDVACKRAASFASMRDSRCRRSLTHPIRGRTTLGRLGQYALHQPFRDHLNE